MDDSRRLSLACSRASRAFQTLGNALLIAGDGAKFASAASVALAFESAVDADPVRRRELLAVAAEFFPVAVDSLRSRFSPETVRTIELRLSRAIKSFHERTTP